MESDRNYLAVGVFVLLAALGVIGFTVWMVGPRDKSKYNPYLIRFNESVAGLDEGGAVKFRGVNVGKVSRITIDSKDSRRIRVDVNILKTAPIKTDTVASLKLQGITGVVFVELAGGESNAPDLVATGEPLDGDYEPIPEIRAESSSINTILNVLPDILQKVSGIADQLGKLFNDENVQTVHDMLTEWHTISVALSKQTAQLQTLLDNSNLVASDLHQVISGSRGDVEKLIKNLQHTSAQLDALVTHTGDSAGGQFQQLYRLMGELKQTSHDISELTRSLHDNPAQLIAPPEEKGIPAP